jgi:hypothetical protein
VLAEYDPTLWLLLLAILLLPIDVGVRRLIVTRRELATIAAALPFVRTASATREPAVPLVSALRERRAQRDGPASQSPPGVASGVRLPRSIAPSSALRSAERGSASLEDEEAEEESIASRLLAARRKKA